MAKMTSAWASFFDEVNSEIERLDDDGCDYVVFRGQSDCNWNLQPSLFRLKKIMDAEDFDRLESALYFDFVTYSARVAKFSNSWETLFEMRHRGIPTRLLDWSESFATALYFALKQNCDSPCIWILNPYHLNNISTNDPSLINPLVDLAFQYENGFLRSADSRFPATELGGLPDYYLYSSEKFLEDARKQPYEGVIAIVPPLASERLYAQRGLFTLQGIDETPIDLNSSYSGCVKRIEIPVGAKKDAKKFLELGGVNEFSVFPDLDGLARYLTSKYIPSLKA